MIKWCVGEMTSWRKFWSQFLSILFTSENEQFDFFIGGLSFSLTLAAVQLFFLKMPNAIKLD
jgi:hypothetical protein